MDELYRHYGSAPRGARGVVRCLRFWRKKYAWILVVGGAKVLKRALDVMAATVLLTGLSPLFLVVMILIKLTDRGPVLFWQTRVGRWGASFHFLNFAPWLSMQSLWKTRSWASLTIRAALPLK
jgi:lipopolysaccharide/colanic/teichoic acid biosynthesis glycosyltransferase